MVQTLDDKVYLAGFLWKKWDLRMIFVSSPQYLPPLANPLLEKKKKKATKKFKKLLNSYYMQDTFISWILHSKPYERGTIILNYRWENVS